MVGIKMLRLPALNERSGKGRSTTYREIKAGLFPPGIRVSERAVAWPEHEVDELLRARIAGATEDQIRELVKRLVAQRAERQTAP